MRFLVATDGSEVSDGAVEYAANEASAWNSPLEIVHVLTPEPELVDGKLVLPGEDEAMQYGEQTLEQARHLASETAAAFDTDTEIEISTELLAGRPAETIAEYADEIEASAIYVGHRGLSDERERVVGSVAKTVVDKATVPVTIIK